MCVNFFLHLHPHYQLLFIWKPTLSYSGTIILLRMGCCGQAQWQVRPHHIFTSQICYAHIICIICLPNWKELWTMICAHLRIGAASLFLMDMLLVCNKTICTIRH